ncbi:MAG: molybdenum cofactor biosynthesis protein MoaE, partial [Stenotrophomonas maltophilia]|nr:molybdenum cofactor biosynthesis protein MoaE [Stenotrophomonas maltophilia]
QEHYEDGDSQWSEGCSLCHAESEPSHSHGHTHDHGH